ncbi:MAG: OB-fold domain-containing protein [Dehalococcoidia bacterium]|jgi:uncharacterized OB-fold protein
MNAATATVYAITTVYVAASEFADKAPYTIAILEASDGDHFLGFIDSINENDVSVGEKVKFLCLNESGRPVYSTA